MAEYLTVLGDSAGEYCEKRSKFIANLRHCETEEEAIAFLEEIRTKYWDARHNVYAYSVSGGALSRFSDDGEPHGTAGKPVLDVLAGSGLTDAIIVVTRYFGGVLLGTGGLVRAYSKAAKEAVSNAQIVRMVEAAVFNIECDYSEHKTLTSIIENGGGDILNTEFTDKVNIELCLKNEYIEDFLQRISEAFSGRLRAFEKEKRILPEKV